MARTSSQNKGVSLAKGPVGILGLIGIVYGLSGLIFASHGFALHIPHGAVHGKKWIGLDVNGWSELLFIAAGGLLLFAAPLHWGAKSMSLLVGWVMIVAAVIALIRGNGVFGIFAANHLTELIWAAAGLLLLVLALLPRVGGRRHDQEGSGDRPRRGRVVEPAGRTEPTQEPARPAGARIATSKTHESREGRPA
jgi:hypothetical protein